jgi:choline dehydrogenase
VHAFDVVVVGAGTAGCVLAARLSEDPARSVCLLEAGPDYGPFTGGRWPGDLLDPRFLPDSHDWGPGGEDGRSLGARVIGGSSSHNACMMLAGSPADYDEWGAAWAWRRFAPFVERAATTLRTQPANTTVPAPMHAAFIAAARARGFALLDAPNDPEQPVGVAPIPANVAEGVRWNAAFAYLDPARGRPNLHIRAESIVDRLLFAQHRVTAIQLASGSRLEAGAVLLTAGAYMTPAILLRSGVGPEQELKRHGITPVADLPVGQRLLDHCGTGLAWAPSEQLLRETRAHADATGPVFGPHAVLKAASSGCAPGSWDLHLLSWLDEDAIANRYEPTIGVFHVKPRGAGSVRLSSTDPAALPRIERGFLSDRRDLDELVEGLELARSLAATAPLRASLGAETRPGHDDLEGYVRATIRNYFHPAGTCPLGTVVDDDGRVLGTGGLIVADASIMPTIPRANTNLTVAAIAERIAATL